MSIDPIEALSGEPAVANMAQLGSASIGAPQVFGNLFTRGVEQVNQQLLRADMDAQALASGQAVSLHQVMIDLEEAKLSFELLAQVRNRLLESYQEVMRTQV